MAEGHNVARVPLQLSRNCIVASIQVDLDDNVLGQFRTDLLEMLQRTSASAVILDVSGIEILDLVEFQALRDTMAMASLMGARTIFSGFRAGVVSALVELDAPVDDIIAAFNLDAAFEALEATEQAREPEPEVANDVGDASALLDEWPENEH
jgi:rsbT antagonist protein RsbS